MIPVASQMMGLAKWNDQAIIPVRVIKTMMNVTASLLLHAHLLADQAGQLGDAGHPLFAGHAHMSSRFIALIFSSRVMLCAMAR